MFSSRKMMLLLSAVGIAITAGCGTWVAVAYTPNPAAVSNAPEDFQRLVMTAKTWRPTKIEMHDTFATLTYIGANIPGGVQTVTVPFKEITKIEVLQKGEQYILRATDAAGQKIYEYVSINQKNAQDLADVFAALIGAKQ